MFHNDSNNSNTEPSQLSPAALAFYGDAVYTLLVREHLVSLANQPARQLHKAALSFVSASAQAKAALLIMPELTENELSVFKRGRNAHTSHTPKNQSNSDYHSATGLEALFGWLSLENNTERLYYLFNIITGGLNEENEIR